MKLKFIYLLILSLTVLFASSCIKDNNVNPGNANNAPTGTFTGQFWFLHLHSSTGKVDTIKANLQLNMEVATGFKITGDTASVHAGSYGSYIINSSFTGIDFIDRTYPASGITSKFHLTGVYQYSYDGNNLQILSYGPLDTTAVYYNMKKTGN